ncbi:MAG TPA: 5-oxoprolinase subunit PxpB [Chitinophagaceae bacterium]|nr:5-oxoprolinase subunit PxpB [Chitinophagaceae bacterium]
MSDRSVVLDLGNTIDEVVNRKVLSVLAWMRAHTFPGLRDLVAAYSSLTVLYDPVLLYKEYMVGYVAGISTRLADDADEHSGHAAAVGGVGKTGLCGDIAGVVTAPATAFELVKQKLEEAWHQAEDFGMMTDREISIPVCYDPRFGPDLEEMARTKNLTVHELVQLHCSTTYRVYMLGFLPGFPYMGKVDERLVMPRRPQPRDVAAGSVGIAGWQTGIYPLASPGGWQIIGRTPLKLFNAAKDPPVLLNAGDMVRFYPVTVQEFESLNI